MKNVFICPGKYVQGRDVIDEIGSHAKSLGQKVIILWSPGIKKVIGDQVATSFKEASLEFTDVIFGGESTRAEASRVAQLARDYGAEVMLGAGGGKALDTAKAAAADAKLKMITCPTIASNDTPTSSATVWYDADGNFEGFECWPSNPDLVLVDSAIIAHAPTHAFVAGMGDALSTWIEAEASFKTRATNLGGGRSTMAAIALARLAYDNLMEYGVAAKNAVENNLVTHAVERIIETNVLLSGIGFESGGLATAHMVANLLSNFPECKQQMHGDKVSFGIITQLFLDEDMKQERIEEIYDFLIDVGLPVTFAELDIPNISEQQLTEIGALCTSEGSLCSNHCFEICSQDVVDSMKAADDFGKRRKLLRRLPSKFLKR